MAARKAPTASSSDEAVQAAAEQAAVEAAAAQAAAEALAAEQAAQAAAEAAAAEAERLAAEQKAAAEEAAKQLEESQGSDSSDGQAGSPDPSEAEAEDARVAALAALVAGPDAGAEVPSEVGADRPALPVLSGEVHEWGGDAPYVVLVDLYNAPVGKVVLTARKGDVVFPGVDVAERGVSLGALVAVPHED